MAAIEFYDIIEEPLPQIANLKKPTFQHAGLKPEEVIAASCNLSFPGKLLSAKDYIFISDSGHNRIVIVNS